MKTCLVKLHFDNQAELAAFYESVFWYCKLGNVKSEGVKLIREKGPFFDDIGECKLMDLNGYLN